MAGYKKRGRRRGPLAALGHALLCAVDALCEGIGAAFAALARALGRSLLALGKGLWWLLVHLLGLLAAVLVAMAVYFVACLLLRVKELGYVVVAIMERLRRKKAAG